MNKKIAVVDYGGPAPTIYLCGTLRGRGYEVFFARKFSELQNLEDLNVLLMHPGVDEQQEAIEFAMAHHKVKSAIITPSPGHYISDEIPIFDSDKPETIVKFVNECF